MTAAAQAFELGKLGHDDKELRINSREDYRHAVLGFAEQAAQRLLIFSRDLDARLFDQAPFVEACKQLVLRHERCHVRMLVQNAESLRGRDSRLISLMQRLPSRIELKICHEEHQSHPEQFMIADNSGLILQRVADRLNISANCKAPLAVKQYEALFNSIWEVSEIDSSLRRLSL
ncbi:MAG: hypothetical protein PVG66_16250 [Chromatiales bacterium]|jgi:hypothetical protein